ncbi:MAG TPA: efflux RND transporter periplasmic adaptor subunit [Chitinophagaceae bacterium]|jgi:multidrug efflux pump subunit AcrA (membrane-fusion protein)|nr:efflux RND transporter periplasmic adaptor subunit [Chitinophagaceae bacterium]
MRKDFIYFLFLATGVGLMACHHKTTETEEEVAPEQVQTPVTITSISNEPLVEYAELNATSIFQQDNIVKSNINGFIKSVNIKHGQYVGKGQTLFILKTKEAESLGNTINKLDSSFHFTGTLRITSPESGYITELPHQVGDYVQDGEQLAVISNSKSFGFILNLPYELRKYVSLNKNVELVLPDETHLSGVIALLMPTIDSASQTQQILIKVPSSANIPENLIAKVRILKSEKTNAISLPKQAVLSDESQTNFWVMKMIDSVTAVKVPVIKGMETGDRVEIVRPQFSVNDKILLSGNYGLPDTAKVRIVKE